MFGEVVRRQRRQAGLTQQDLADRAGVGVRTLRAIETGQGVPRASTVRLLADALALAGADRERFYASAVPAAGGPAAGRTAREVTPAQLPGDVFGFTGRAAQLDRLDRIAARAGLQPTAVVISAVWGTAGIGKTALAVHWARRVSGRFPDGQLYVNLRGFDPTGMVMDPAEAVRRFLTALDVSPQRLTADLDALAALYRTRLAGRRMLILLDNARDVDQVRPLLPTAPGCLVLVTSRNRLDGLVAAEGAHPLPLDLLTDGEARELLARRAGAERCGAEPDAVDEIITRCARLPLALAVVAARAATRPGLALAALAGELRQTGDRLDVLTTGDNPSTDLRAVFSWSYHALSPAAARLWQLLALHPGPNVSAAAAASLAAVDVLHVRPLLAELARAHLIDEPTPDRYAFHDLLRAYAAEQANDADREEERHATTHRMIDHYLHTARAADRLLDPARDEITIAPARPGTAPEAIADHEQALAWFTVEHQVLLALIRHAPSAGFDLQTAQLAYVLWTFLERRGQWHDQVTAQHAATLAGQRLAQPAIEARGRGNLARAYLRLGRYDDADTNLRRTLELNRRTGNPVAQAHTHTKLAQLQERQGHHAEALDHAGQALELYRAAGHRTGQANCLNSIGWLYAQLGRYEQALASCQEALPLHEEVGDVLGEAGTWDSIGYAHHHLGHHADAITCYGQALDLFRTLGDRYFEAVITDHLGDAQLAAGEPGSAREAWRVAVAILDDLGHADAEAVRAKLKRTDLGR